MLEIVFEIVGEFLIQAMGEALVELGLHSMAETFRSPPNPWLAAIGYAIFGSIIGGFSLIAFPENLVAESWRVANLFVTPIAVGCLMVLMGLWRVRRGQTVLRIDRFAYGYIFALTFAGIRYLFAA